MFGALRQYNYRLWATADLISITGTWMQVLGVNWYLLQTTGSAAKMGLGVLLQSLPVLLLGPYAGALADRIRPRPLLVASQFVHAALAAGLALVAFAGSHALWPVYLISLLSGVVSAIDGPALGRFGSMVVGPKALGNALAFGSLINSTGRIVGMSLGGVLVATAGAGALFAGNAVSFLAVVAALLLMRPREWHPLASATDAPAAERGIRAGFAYLLRQPVVLVTLALSLVLGCLGRNYQVTMAAMSDGPLHAGAAGYGLLSTVFAVGTAVGALVAAHRSELTHRLLLAAAMLGSTLQLFSGLTPGLAAFAVVILPIASAAIVIDTAVAARVQLDTREDMRGRVVSAMTIVASLSGMVGAPLLGWLSEVLGARTALMSAGTVCLLACAAAAVLLARLTAAEPASAPAAAADAAATDTAGADNAGAAGAAAEATAPEPAVTVLPTTATMAIYALIPRSMTSRPARRARRRVGGPARRHLPVPASYSGRRGPGAAAARPSRRGRPDAGAA
ncbi:MFS transporter [Planosporangium flavigriseum]|uniref:MFS transporter n=1 Tax=Planosporangium flavigriseum TaxID=373681 RepID=A0A8J3LPP2_9ACTN|nr:MFS transporter [Planosporangium flavigriseum]NJC65901.1 MFS transporter [Planosporangium flavigriseum]GIG75607.1 MFS transporter [Planosporangium flavigriseum]